MHPRRLLPTFALLATAALLPAQDARFTGEVEVRVHEVAVRVLGPDGRATPGLTAGDFTLVVDGKPVAPSAVDWFGPAPRVGESGPGTPPASPAPTGGDVARPPPGRVIVLFFQLDMRSSRLPGLVRMARRVSDLVRSLTPDDRTAVATLGSHLELRLDLTADHAALLEAIRPTSLFGPPPEAPSTPDEPSLLPAYDLETAKRVTNPEGAVKVIAEALAPIPGAKSVVFVGWGMGRFGRTGVRLGDDYAAAREALSRARATVFTLDVTDADRHSLELGLQRVADDTGGLYERTHELGWGATVRVQEALSGFYLVVFPCPDPQRKSHTLKVRLKDRAGEVLAPTRVHHAAGPG